VHTRWGPKGRLQVVSTRSAVPCQPGLSLFSNCLLTGLMQRRISKQHNRDMPAQWLKMNIITLGWPNTTEELCRALCYLDPTLVSAYAKNCPAWGESSHSSTTPCDVYDLRLCDVPFAIRMMTCKTSSFPSVVYRIPGGPSRGCYRAVDRSKPRNGMAS